MGDSLYRRNLHALVTGVARDIGTETDGRRGVDDGSGIGSDDSQCQDGRGIFWAENLRPTSARHVAIDTESTVRSSSVRIDGIRSVRRSGIGVSNRKAGIRQTGLADGGESGNRTRNRHECLRTARYGIPGRALECLRISRRSAQYRLHGSDRCGRSDRQRGNGILPSVHGFKHGRARRRRQ